jgi:hypothetical protein
MPPCVNNTLPEDLHLLNPVNTMQTFSLTVKNAAKIYSPFASSITLRSAG